MASASRLCFWLRLWLKLGLRPRLGLGLGLGWAEAGPGCVAALHYDYSRHMPITSQEGVVMVTQGKGWIQRHWQNNKKAKDSKGMTNRAAGQ